uniref:Major facilitator superfamily (MFS) profile domain-containing protein n=1 Tax=Oryza glumipatula TaxID=40148 RepID=A0A0E0B741_9ORYZ
MNRHEEFTDWHVGTECLGQLAFFGVQYSLVTFLTTQLRQGNAEAARNFSMWQGTCYIAPLAGAIVADSCLGRYRTILSFFSIYIIGMGTMALSGASPAVISRSTQPAVFSLGLYLMAIGAGCIKSCVGPFGADQFDGGDAMERPKKSSYFNWFYFAMYVGALVSGSAVVWLQDNFGWLLGFGVPALCTVLAMASFLLGSAMYRYHQPRGSPVVRACQVVVAAVRKRNVVLPHDGFVLYDGLIVVIVVLLAAVTLVCCAGWKAAAQWWEAGKRARTVIAGFVISCDRSDRALVAGQFRFLDKAAVAVAVPSSAAAQPWRLCTVTQVEELKAIVRMLPVWATGIVYCMVLVQQPLFPVQGRAMRRRLGVAFAVPAASLNSVYAAAMLVLVPLYDAAVVPAARRLTGSERGLTELQRIGAGMALSVAAMAAAATVEGRRLAAAGEVSIAWQVPQYVLLGASAVLAHIGQLEFFYNQAPDSMRSLCSALGHMTCSLGSYLSSVVVTVVSRATARGGSPGWIADDIDDGHLDRFFWLVAGLSSTNLVVFICCAKRYKYKDSIN